MNIVVRCLFLLVAFYVNGALCLNPEAEKWYTLGREALLRRLKQITPSPSAEEVARNIIVFVGDGLSVPTLTAARILKGQRAGLAGEQARLVWDDFPNVALAQTYNANAQVGESSACATSLWCGVKANYETVGLDSTSKFGNCLSSFSSRIPSILTWAQEQGKTSGIVTTTRISHATPAALYAHAPSRYWEDDSKASPAMRRHCKDITRQLVEDEPGKKINVLLGGGRRHWFSMNTHDPDNPEKVGRRLDGRNLITEWLRNKKDNDVEAQYVWNKDQLDKVNTSTVDYLLGLFAYSHMDFETDRNNQTEPSLAEMTKVALKILNKNLWGFFLVVEGGRIDHAHHYNNAYRALDETLALEEAVNVALNETNLEETLIIVTADHGHVMTFGGHGTKTGNPIFAYDNNLDANSLPYTTLLYGNGPGHQAGAYNDVTNKNTIQASAVDKSWSTHGGEDVPVFVTGPLSNLFSGSFDQSYIPHAISFASCLGAFKDRCNCLFFNCDDDYNSTSFSDLNNHIEVMNLENQVAEYFTLVNSNSFCTYDYFLLVILFLINCLVN